MNILVTGISKGLGLITAKTLLHRGASVFGLSRKITPELQALINQYPDTLVWRSFDLQHTDSIRELFRQWVGNETAIHGFVNNAAIACDDLITNLDPALLEHMFRINVFSPMVLTKYVIRQMLLHHVRGSIIHVSSISVHTGYKGLAMYASTKGALEAFSKNTAREWGERGIRSNCVVAGFMETDMNMTLSQDQKTRIYSRTALKCPVDILSVAEMIAFLLSTKAVSITGQSIHVDSGTI